MRQVGQLQLDGDEAITKVGVVFAILKVLDSGAMDTQSLREAVTEISGEDASSLYFKEALRGLEGGHYIQLYEGRWRVTGLGAG